MPKIKTHQATAKRYFITKKGSVKKRKAGQDHFNGKETGKVGINKRRDVLVHHTETRNIQSFIPYN
ncbi:MAG TPA: 50S ribosomal protein L35 [Candidatus Nanoarchaeia archaeon]|nr:50S ribosomal protein L35 [Candidatus Nanoarchaeia archaeon]